MTLGLSDTSIPATGPLSFSLVPFLHCFSSSFLKHSQFPLSLQPPLLLLFQHFVSCSLSLFSLVSFLAAFSRTLPLAHFPFSLVSFSCSFPSSFSRSLPLDHFPLSSRFCSQLFQQLSLALFLVLTFPFLSCPFSPLLFQHLFQALCLLLPSTFSLLSLSSVAFLATFCLSSRFSSSFLQHFFSLLSFSHFPPFFLVPFPHCFSSIFFKHFVSCSLSPFSLATCIHSFSCCFFQHFVSCSLSFFNYLKLCCYFYFLSFNRLFLFRFSVIFSSYIFYLYWFFDPFHVISKHFVYFLLSRFFFLFMFTVCLNLSFLHPPRNLSYSAFFFLKKPIHFAPIFFLETGLNTG